MDYKSFLFGIIFEVIVVGFIYLLYKTIVYIKENKNKKINDAMDKMSQTYIEHEIPFTDGENVHVLWAECVSDIPYIEATKVFMYYQKLKRKHMN